MAYNGAFGCSLKGSAADRGKLSFPVEFALAALQKVSGRPYAATLIHHPVGDFTESTTRGLQPLLENRSRLHLFGHVHRPRPIHTASPSGACLFIQGGALYERHGAYNGYAYVRSSDDREHQMVLYRTYWPDRFQFDVGTNVANGGVFFSNDTSRRYWEHVKANPTNEAICAWLEDSIHAQLSELNESITDKPLNEVFVEPRIVRPSQGDEAPREDNLERQASISTLITSDANFVIAADHEYGATALLKRPFL